MATAGCRGPSDGASATSRVDASGAKLELAGQASLQVPSGALNDAVNLTMSIVEAPRPTPSAAVSKVLELTPHGTHFAAPVTISLSYASSADPAELKVLRLASPNDDAWRPVGGARFANGRVTFESTTFSDYVVVQGFQCAPMNEAVACGGGCECCGTAWCVELATSPDHCGACGNACGSSSFCATGGTCVPLASTDLCQNQSLYVLEGELPASLVHLSPEQTADGISSAAIANTLANQCGLSPVTVSQAELGILDPCTNAPLLKGGTTILLVGGSFSQRLAKYLEASGSPVKASFDVASDRYTFTSRAGAKLFEFANSTLSPGHDYFVVSLTTDPLRGALVFQVYGIGWEGTPAATWYFQNTLMPEIVAKTRSWQQYLVVEWTDNGNGVKDAGDSFTVLARDLP